MIKITNEEYAVRIYCRVFCVTADNGDACIRGILDAIDTLEHREKTALESHIRHRNTLAQTGELLGGIKSEATRRIVQKAISKLKHPSRFRSMSLSRTS